MEAHRRPHANIDISVLPDQMICHKRTYESAEDGDDGLKGDTQSAAQD